MLKGKEKAIRIKCLTRGNSGVQTQLLIGDALFTDWKARVFY